MAQDDLESLKYNISFNKELYTSSTSEWIEKKLEHNPFIPYKKSIEPFDLNPKMSEIYNTKIMYNALKDLPDSDAVDERLWVGLTHGIFWNFMRENTIFSLRENARLKFDYSFIENRYFLNIRKNAKKRSLYINSLSKLWWTGRLTYDDSNEENPYQYLSLFETAFSHKIINTFSSNFMANKDIRFALFETGLHLKSLGIEIKGDTLVPLMKHLNELGGSFILDLFSREELTDVLIKYAHKHLDVIKKR